MLMATLLSGPAVAKADAVLDWNEIAVNTAIANGQNPFAQARYGAIVQLAVFEAVNSITGDYRPYLGTIVAPHGASPDAAAIQAAYRVLSTYFPGSAATLNAARTNSLASIPDGQAKTDSIATGDSAALAMIALRANDGSSPAQFKIPGPPVPGEYQATPSCPVVNGVAVGTLFQWQNVTPFGIKRASDFLLDPPPALTSNRKTEADPSFLPFILTPCFPSYPSNHGSGTNAAAEVMRRLYGEAGHSITVSNPAVPAIVLQYTSFRQIADDVSDARVYGGIHFRTDQDAGARLGRAVGTAVYKNNLRAVNDDDRDDD